MIKKTRAKVGSRICDINVEMYNSAEDMVNDCRVRNITDSSFHDMTRDRIKKSWHGCSSYDEAIEMMKTGYQPTVEKFKEALKVNRSGESKRISFQNNVHGFAPIVPLALKGVPNSTMNMTMKPIKCKVIDVYYDMAVCSRVDTEQIIKNGQELLSVIVELEKQGYRFNLYAVQSYSDDYSADILCVKVKSSDKPLDLKRISFPMTHPAFLRVIGFDWYSRCPVAKYRSGYGQGISYKLKSESQKREFGNTIFGDNAVYMSAGYLGDENSIKEALTDESKA